MKKGESMKDGVVTRNQKPDPKDILDDLHQLLENLPCYGTVKTEFSLTGKILEITINCKNVLLVIVQDRHENGMKVVILETHNVSIDAITAIWQLPDPFKR